MPQKAPDKHCLFKCNFKHTKIILITQIGCAKKLYMFSPVGITFPLYELSSYESTFLVGKRPVNVCKKLDVSVCEDIRLQLRSIAYGVETNGWRDNINTAEKTLKFKDYVSTICIISDFIMLFWTALKASMNITSMFLVF